MDKENRAKLIKHIISLCNGKQLNTNNFYVKPEREADVIFIISSIPGIERSAYREAWHHLSSSMYLLTRIELHEAHNGLLLDMGDLSKVLRGTYIDKPICVERKP